MKMIKKFRNKVLILNMVITSAVVLSAFGVIYFIIYSNINYEIQDKLEQAPGRYGSVVAEASGSSSDSSYLMFSILVDAQGNILEKAAGLNFEPGFYAQAAEIALDNPNNRSYITLGGKEWRYMVTPIVDARLSETGTSQVVGSIGTVNADKFSIVFLEVTAYNKTLFDLMKTLLFVGSVTLVAIFLISLYFANRTIKPLADTWQKQKQFVADASHELKTPLSIINANYDALLANREETIESQIKWLDYIRVGTDRMSTLINNLLTLAKFDDTELVTQSISFNLSETVQSVLSSMEAAIIEKGIELSTSIEPDVFIKSDIEQLKQVITILLDNAIKYTDKNGQIDILLSQSNHQAIFSIKNSGKGIPKQEIPKIFDRFYRADHSRTHENGSYGLGLSIAKAIMDTLDGDIQVQSVEEEYTTFSFRLKL